jgi:hypothetical protein
MLMPFLVAALWIPTLGFAVPVQAAAAGESIALVPLEVSGGMNVSRTDLEAAVLKGLSVAGRPLIGPDDAAVRAAAARTDLTCRSASCWSNLATLVNAGYVVAGSAARQGGSFRVSFRLLRASDGSTVASEANDCEVADCSIAELARRSARELVRTTLGRPGGERVADATELAPRRSPAPAAAVRAKAKAPASAGGSGFTRVLWPTLVVVGAASVGAGAWLLSVNGQLWHQSPPYDDGDDVYTLPHGIAAIAGGVLLGATSIYFIVRGQRARGPSVALGVGPGSLFATGRF